MATQAIIARLTDPDDPTKFAGMYVGGDGYPTHTGRAVWRQVVAHFRGDLDQAARYYIDQHPTGWKLLGAEAIGDDICYCHDMHEGEQDHWLRTQDQVDSIDYTYVLRPEGLEILRHGRGAGRLIVPWDQERVNWEAIQEKAIAL